MSDRVTVYPEGSKTGVILTPAHHLATGGEGTVYLRDGEVYKVYRDPDKVLANGIDRKVPLLRKLKHPGIAAPQKLLFDQSGRPIGLTLPLVAGEALCKAFTNTWRDANGFAEPQTLEVVESMRDIVSFAHANQAVMADANELNYLLKATQPVAIDVDSWQIPGFPANVIMPSIRDHFTSGFTQATDWFAWGIVTFQLFTGVHPYKGTHPNFGRSMLTERMKAMASVFDPGVQLPPAARDMACIPPRLRDWYCTTFSSTQRSTPPSVHSSAVASQVAPRLKVIQASTATLSIERLGSMPGKVAASMNGFLILRQGRKLLLWDVLKRDLVTAPEGLLKAVLEQKACLLRLPSARVIVHVDAQRQCVQAMDLDGGATSELHTVGQRVWQSNNRCFLLVEGVPLGLHELDVRYLGQGASAKLLLSQKLQWPASVLSCQFGRNAFVQDVLGMPFFGIVTSNGLVQAPAKSLQGYRVAEIFAGDPDNVWVSATRVRDGEQVRLRLHHEVDRFELDDETVVSDLGLDAGVTDAGVAVLRMGDELLAAKGTARRRVSCAGLDATLQFFGAGAGVYAFSGTEVVKVSLK